MILNKTTFPYTLRMLLCLTAILLACRVVLFRSHYYDYLVWNIFLASVPIIISAVMLWLLKKNIQTKALYVFMGIVWLFFFPNAPYIITDLLHLGKIPNSLIVYDTFLLFSAAWLGLLLGFHSLFQIEGLIQHFYSIRIRNICLVFILSITSLGIYIGRFLRFNSWDTIANPVSIVSKVAIVLSGPKDSREFYIFTGITFIFLLFSYLSWRYDRKSRPEAYL